jgi:hypothetical protein
MNRWVCTIIKDSNGTYYADMYINGDMVKGLPEYSDYKTLKEAIKNKTGITILNHILFFNSIYKIP